MATIVDAPMTLDFDVCQESDCTSFDVTDQTGLYSSGNTGGYGSPNFAIADAIDARLYITDPTGVQTIITCYPTLPDSTGTSAFTVNATDLNITGSLPDGVYVIKYQVDFNNVSSQTIQKEVVKTILLTCTIKCCVDKLISKIPTADCSCEDKQLKNALLAFGLYQGLTAAGKCGNLTAVTNLLARLTKLCAATSCDCGS